MCADAVLDVSATEVAVTVKFVPAVDPAVNRPVLEIVPPVADQVTAALELPVTDAVNCCVCPGWSVTVVGEIEIVMAGGAWTVTCADAVLVVSATEVAVTVKFVPAV